VPRFAALSICITALHRSFSHRSIAGPPPPVPHIAELAVPRLLEPLLIQAITARFRSLNVVVSASSMTTASTKTGPALTQSRLTPSLGNSAVMRPPSAPSAPVPIPYPSITTATPSTALVQPASRSAADLQAQAQVSDELSKYITAISHAIVVAHDNWRQRACLKGVQINGVTAIGGSVSGPLLSEMLVPFGPSQGLWGNAAAYTAAIGNGLASAWREWEQSIRVPGLMWYPSFAAVPAPQAPAIPNIPTPLGQLAMASGLLSSEHVNSLIKSKLPKPGPYADPLFASVADGFSKAVASWLPTQMVTGVLGRGPVPVFAPPYVPVGAVIGGTIIEVGPHFAT
jgi:hypothetical protein